jgi:hypothetical protein
MSGYGFIVSEYGNAPFATGPRRYEDSKTRWRDSLGCDTIPLFTGGLRGSFRFLKRILRADQSELVVGTPDKVFRKEER